MSNTNKEKYIEYLIRLTETNGGNSYYNTDLRSMDVDFKSFCKEKEINFSQVRKIGREKSKHLLLRYFTDEIDGNLTKEDCENLYRLFADPWDNSKLERHEMLASFINLVALKRDLTLKKVLILGAGTGGEYEQLRKICPMTKFLITDISEQALNSFQLKYNGNGSGSSYTLQILDVFCRRSLSSILKSRGKFDLIIASGVYRYAPSKQKKYNSAEFIYKYLLKHDGLFCIVEVSQDPEYDDPFILRRLTPIFTKKTQTNMRINPTQFVFYEKTFELQ